MRIVKMENCELNDINYDYVDVVITHEAIFVSENCEEKELVRRYFSSPGCFPAKYAPAEFGFRQLEDIRWMNFEKIDPELVNDNLEMLGSIEEVSFEDGSERSMQQLMLTNIKNRPYKFVFAELGAVVIGLAAEFLSRFEYADGVKVAGNTLSNNWGSELSIGMDRGKSDLLTGRLRDGESQNGYRFLRIDSIVKTLDELRAAFNYERTYRFLVC